MFFLVLFLIIFGIQYNINVPMGDVSPVVIGVGGRSVQLIAVVSGQICHIQYGRSADSRRKTNRGDGAYTIQYVFGHGPEMTYCKLSACPIVLKVINVKLIHILQQ